MSGRLTGPTGRSEAVDLLVETGATFLVVPRPLAEQLDLRTLRMCPSVLLRADEVIQ